MQLYVSVWSEQVTNIFADFKELNGQNVHKFHSGVPRPYTIVSRSTELYELVCSREVSQLPLIHRVSSCWISSAYTMACIIIGRGGAESVQPVAVSPSDREVNIAESHLSATTRHTLR